MTKNHADCHIWKDQVIEKNGKWWCLCSKLKNWQKIAQLAVAGRSRLFEEQYAGTGNQKLTNRIYVYLPWGAGRAFGVVMPHGGRRRSAISGINPWLWCKVVSPKGKFCKFSKVTSSFQVLCYLYFLRQTVLHNACSTRQSGHSYIIQNTWSF